jgi:tRNA threonylcarbamoyladenosine biosynthesis protein TsaB
MLRGQAEALLPMVDDVVREAGLAVPALDLVATTTGPGSFTGIRVGIAAARGIALAADLPLIGISSFDAVAAAIPDFALAGRCLLVALESRRADLYIKLVGAAGDPLAEPMAVLPEALSAAIAGAAALSLAVAGDARTRAAAALAGRSGMIVVEDGTPPVIGVLRAALRRWRQGERGGSLRPLYLRPPDVTLPGGRPAGGV